MLDPSVSGACIRSPIWSYHFDVHIMKCKRDSVIERNWISKHKQMCDRRAFNCATIRCGQMKSCRAFQLHSGIRILCNSKFVTKDFCGKINRSFKFWAFQFRWKFDSMFQNSIVNSVFIDLVVERNYMNCSHLYRVYL